MFHNHAKIHSIIEENNLSQFNILPSKESIESLMTPECLAGAKEQLADLQPGQRFGLEVIKEDVLASWIEQSGEGRLLLVVTSLPGKGWIMRVSLSPKTRNVITLVQGDTSGCSLGFVDMKIKDAVLRN